MKLSQFDSILDYISHERVFDVDVEGSGVVITEGCDDYFGVFLSRNEFFQLIDELKELGKKVNK